MTVDFVEIFRHFAFWRHRTRLASFFTEPKNCIFCGGTFELIKNLATLVPEKLQGFYETLLYHCYTRLRHSTVVNHKGQIPFFEMSRSWIEGMMRQN